MNGYGIRPTGAGRVRRSGHLPLRPLWLCRLCGQPWPCGRARLALSIEYRDNRAGLLLHLSGVLHEALDDLHRLNPDTTGTARNLFGRFLGWLCRYRSPTDSASSG